MTDNCPNGQKDYDVPHDVYGHVSSPQPIHIRIETHKVLVLTVENFDLERWVQRPNARD
jgi:hypothetical protein